MPNPSNPAHLLNADGFPTEKRLHDTRYSLQNGLHYYTFTDPKDWGTGIRNLHGIISTDTVDSPATSDVRSYHTHIALAPAERRRLAHQYRLFYQTAMRLFSIPGLFAHIIRVTGYPLESLSMQHYPGVTDNITIAIVAAWYGQHGIIPESNAVTLLESFSRGRRNMAAGVADFDNVGWADEPRNYAEATTVDNSTYPSWAEMHRTMTTPRPDSGMAGSMHAPEKDVEMAETDDGSSAS
ncbi:hypothetical protein DFH09DRAFT_1080351 [Mycena vulgaris]|nr:hypothetical protein DFH09DRAFT_1080351 [Mycena vulgaris]